MCSKELKIYFTCKDKGKFGILTKDNKELKIDFTCKDKGKFGIITKDNV